MPETIAASTCISAYRLTVEGKRGLPIRPLVLPPDQPPFPDESLLGLIARTASRNGFDSLRRVLSLADVDNLRAEAVPTTRFDRIAQIAFVLRVPENEVACRMLPAVEHPDRPTDLIDFYGMTLRACYRRSSLRRVSPRSLRASPHHRAAWDLLPFSICPDSRETLISSCPVCGADLGWRRTVGIAACETCVDDDGDPTVDLRDHVGPVVQVADDEAFRLVTGLVHPDRDRRATERKKVAAALADHADGELFEFMVALAYAMATMNSGTTGMARRLRHLADFSALSPDALAHAARVVMTWPKGFHDLAEKARGGADHRPGFYGVYKELGPLFTMGSDYFLADGLKSLVASALKDNMASADTMSVRLAHKGRSSEWITARNVQERYGFLRRNLSRLAADATLGAIKADQAKRSPLLFPVAVIEDLAGQLQDLVAAKRVTSRLGIPPGGVSDLARVGLVTRASGPVLRLVDGDLYYTSNSVTAFETRVRACAGSSATPGLTPLSAAVKRLGPGERPWAAIMTSILEGRLSVHLLPETNVPLIAQIGMPDLGPLIAVAAAADVVPPEEDDRISFKEAGDIIGAGQCLVSGLVRLKLIPRSGHAHLSLRRVDVHAFCAEFALTSEVAERSGVKRQSVKAWMSERGIEPVVAGRGERGHVWRRENVERALIDHA